MDCMRNMQNVLLKMPFYYEMLNVWKAMLVAYGLVDKDNLQFQDKQEGLCGEDGDWIIQLSELIKEHWEKEKSGYESCLTKTNQEESSVVGSDESSGGLKEWIDKAEAENKKFMEENPGREKLGGMTCYNLSNKHSVGKGRWE